MTARSSRHRLVDAVEEAAGLRGVARSTMDELVRSDEVGSVRIGRRVCGARSRAIRIVAGGHDGLVRHVTIAAVLVLAGVGAGGCESAIEAACHDGGEAATAWWSLEDLAREDVAFVGRVTGVSGASVDTIPEGTTAPYRRTTMAVDRLLWDDDEGVGPVGGDVVLRDDGCSGGPPRGSTWLVVAGPRGADDLTSSFGRQARWRVDGAGIATNGSHPELTGVPVDHVVATLLALRPSPPVG